MDSNPDQTPIMKSTTLCRCALVAVMTLLTFGHSHGAASSRSGTLRPRIGWSGELCRLVCDRLLDIGDAQEAIIKDWIAAYHL